MLDRSDPAKQDSSILMAHIKSCVNHESPCTMVLCQSSLLHQTLARFAP